MNPSTAKGATLLGYLRQRGFMLEMPSTPDGQAEMRCWLRDLKASRPKTNQDKRVAQEAIRLIRSALGEVEA